MQSTMLHRSTEVVGRIELMNILLQLDPNQHISTKQYLEYTSRN